MPPERKIAAPDTTTVEDVMGDAPDSGMEDPRALFMQTVESDNNPYPEGQEPEQEPTHEEEVQVEEQHEEESEAEVDADAKEEGQDGEVEVEDGEDEEVTVSSEAYERLLAMLGMEDEEAPEPEAKEPEPGDVKPEDVKLPAEPLSRSEFKLPTTADELIDIQTDPELYSKHIHSLIQHAVEQTVAAMDPIVHQRAGQVYQAIEFDKKFFEKHPEVPPKLAVLGLATAQKKLGPDASFDDLFSETEKNCAFAMQVAQSRKAATARTNGSRGRNAPRSARTSRPNASPPKVSPTEEVMQKIMSPKAYDAQTVELLRDIGNL